MTEEEQFEQIDRYLNQRLSAEEKKAFELLMTNDTTLAQEVALHQEMATFLSDNQAFELEKKLSTIGEEFSQEYQQRVNATPHQKWQYWIAAASILLISALAWWYTQTTVDNKALFAIHYEVYLSDELERSSTKNFSSPLRAGLNAYIQKDYTTAIQQLEQALQATNAPNNSHESILFYLAVSNIELKNYPLAKEYLNQILKFRNSTYAQQSHWYLALIELQEGNTSKCKTVLEQLLIISEKGKYALQAKTLLQEL